MKQVSRMNSVLHNAHGNRAEKWILVLVSCIAVLGFPFGAFAATPPTVYVSGSGDTGDYICDGSADQVEINQALKFVSENSSYTTVHLKGPFTYVISDSVLIGGKTILEGDSNAILMLAGNCGWPKNKAMIQERTSPSSDIEIRGFHINGNKAGNPGVRPGAYFHNLITLRGCSNVDVHNMYLQGSYNDVLKVSGGKNIEFYNCILHDNGHDGLYAIKCSNVSAHNNVIGIKCNSGLRFDSCTNCRAYANRIFSEAGGGAGIQVQSDGAQVTGIEFYGNKIYKTATFGFWVFARGSLPEASGPRVHIYDNEIVGVRGSAIKVTDFPDVLVENNKISQSGDVDMSMPAGTTGSSASSETDPSSDSADSSVTSGSTSPSSSCSSTKPSCSSSCSPKKSSCSSKKASCSSSCSSKKSSCSSSCSKKSSCSSSRSSKKSSCSSGSTGSSDSSESDDSSASSETSGSSDDSETVGASDSSISGENGATESSGNVENVTNTNELFQAVANAAKNPGTTVHLKGPYTYLITDSLYLSSNTTIEGESGVVVKIARGLPQWGARKAGIAQQKAMFMIKGNSARNVTIRNLTVDGSQSDYYPHITLGWGIFNMATIIGCNGLTITNVTWKNGCNDAMLLSHCSNVLIDKITVNKCGHDGVYCWHVDNVTVSNSKFINRTNSSTRFDYVTNGKFFNNDCTTSGGGYAGLELEDTVTNIDVYGNYFHRLAGPAIAHVHTKETNVRIHDNRIE